MKIILAVALFITSWISVAAEPVALQGIVRSQKEGLMEGVVVSAKRSQSTITVSVVTDKNGAYQFPQSRLSPGSYELAIRAIGYELPQKKND